MPRTLLRSILFLTCVSWGGCVPGAEEPAAGTHTSDVTLRGPDGISYPDFRYAGVPGGIPEIQVVATVSDFGGRPDDGLDDAEAIEQAVAAAAKAGGGAVFLAPGTWHLDRPIEILTSGVVLRGAGIGKTRIESRYRDFSPQQIELGRPLPGRALETDGFLEVVFDPTGMSTARISVSGEQVVSRGSDRGRQVEFWLRVSNRKIQEALLKAGKPASGSLTVVAEVTYGDNAAHPVSGGETGQWTTDATGLRVWQAAAPKNARTVSRTFTVEFTDGTSESMRPADAPAMIRCLGSRNLTDWPLAHAQRRGNLAVTLEVEPEGLQAGDVVEISLPTSEAFKQEILSTVPKGWGTRTWQGVVAGVAGRRVYLNQPLRMEVPLGERATLRRITPLRGVGIESLTIAQTTARLVNTIQFRDAYGCWIKDVRVEKTGRNPFAIANSKFCEVRNLEADDAWYGVRDNMGGGTAYVSFDMVWDCLLDGGRFTGLRHAPNLQGSAMGNVMRDIHAVGSDVQWHAFLTAENLIEDCVVDTRIGKGGSYSYGAFATGPDSEVHGPQLQGNVLWNCDLESSETGFMHLGGPSASGWIVAYNRFRVRGQGPALSVQLGLKDLLFLNNVCQSADPTGRYGVPTYRNPADAPLLFNQEGAAVWSNPFEKSGKQVERFESLNVSGLRVIGNQLHGFKTVFAGKGAPAEERDNQLLPLMSDQDAPRPTAPVPSLFRWQQTQFPPPAGDFPRHPQARVP